jgi:hypothetical protein
MFDLNNAPPQRDGEPIPDGIFVKLVTHIRPGAASLEGLDPVDDGLLRASNTSDALMLDAEFTVMGGAYNGRKLWSMLTIAGGKLNEKGESKGWLITKSTLRAMIESATATDPNDMSDAARAKRVFRAFKQLDGIEFYARLGVQPGEPIADKPGQTYPAKNVISHIVTPKDAEYTALRNGQEVTAKPRGATTAKPTAAPSAPAWAQPTASAAAPPSQPTSPPASGKNGPAWLRE